MSEIIIPVYQPSLGEREKRYVNECLDSTWISSKGKYLGLFEDSFKRYTGSKHATAVCNGTVAVHLAMLTLGLEPGDEVIVPTFTYIASVNPILYEGATPIFVDSERASWQIDPADVERKITSRTRAIMVVHLYGHPANMKAIMDIARRHNLFVIEDCAEAFGARIDGQHVGTFGDIATFSFFGNKTVTTGEGGMVVTNDATLIERAIHLKGQGLAMHRTYWHDAVGYNYRMTNMCAALGLAQMERADEIVERKLALAAEYHRLLQSVSVEPHRASRPDVLHSYWMYSVLVPEGQRDTIMDALLRDGIETRPTFYPAHTMPMFSKRYERHRVAEEIARRGINLPSWPDLQLEQVEFIVASLDRALMKRALAA